VKVYKPSDLVAYLNKLGTHAKKSFSQNFLIDKNIIDRIVSDADVSSGDVVLEIGPGPGALTDALLETGATVYAVEKDPLFAQGLRERAHPNLHVIEDDFLKTPLPNHLGIKVVANLPYNITTPIFEKLFENHSSILSMTVMVQKEFADRIVASKNTKAYGSLTLFVELYADVVTRFIVSPNCFYPPPKVTSSVVTLKINRKTVQSDPSCIIRHCFTKRRKMLRVCLKDLYARENIEQAFAALPFTETLRPENLSLTEFDMLATALQSGK